jgi:hypothetical protein
MYNCFDVRTFNEDQDHTRPDQQERCIDIEGNGAATR